MALSTTISNDLISIETDLGSKTFTYSGESYLCSPAGAGENAILQEGGFAVEIDIILVVRKGLFTDSLHPRKGQTLTYSSKTYRVSRVIEDSTGTFLRIFCVQEHRGV